VTPTPLGLLAELTHRCPLRCPYCSNPLDLARSATELDTATWARVFAEAAALGVLQLHLSGGEPLARRDLPALVAAASGAGLYTNLITAGLTLDVATAATLRDAGLDHVQLSFQDADAAGNDRIAGYEGAYARKLLAAAAVTHAGLALTVNAVVHRQNLHNLEAFLALAAALGAGRIEVAHAQFHGWGLVNRDALLPTQAQIDAAAATVASARTEYVGRLVIDHVLPDYHAGRPKACLGGWGRQVIVVTPTGKILPCHAAESLPGFDFPNARDTSLGAAWTDSDAFNRYRGTAWMPDPCRSCDRRERDWGGCRCQAFALTGDAGATDPACALSPHHAAIGAAHAAAGATTAFTYRGTTLPASPARPLSLA
jgi:PqqA peptide cyclase